MLSSLISHYILLMFLNQCHSLRIRIMKLVKANLALSAIPFSVSGNLLKIHLVVLGRLYSLCCEGKEKCTWVEPKNLFPYFVP